MSSGLYLVRIQNPGVDRMSGMSSIRNIALYRDAASHHEPK